MPSTFGIVVLGLALVGVVVGLVLWGLQATGRSGPSNQRSSHPDAPVDENTAAALNVRSADRNDFS